MQATVWHLDGWGSPVTVGGLSEERPQGYFAMPLGLGEVVCDPVGNLYVKEDLELHPTPGRIHRSWLCEVRYGQHGIALHVPADAYHHVLVERKRLDLYLPVAEVF